MARASTCMVSRRAVTTLSAVVLAAAGCLPGEIADFSSQASTRVVHPSSAFEANSGFGRVLAGVYGVTADGTHASRLSVTGGSGTPFASYAIETGGDFKLGSELFHGCSTPASGCPVDFGATAVGLTSFGAEHLCTAFGAPASDELDIACESDLGTIQALHVAPGTSTQLGQALAELPTTSPWGVALVGAPGASAIYVLAPDTSLNLLPLPASLEGATVGIGEVLAAAPLPESASNGLTEAVLVVTRLPSVSRLLMLAVGIDPSVGSLASLRLGCVDGVEGELTVAAGDVTADGVPEVFFSTATAPTFAHLDVRQLDVTTLFRESDCLDPGTADDPVTTKVICPDLDPSVACAGFGETLATGDLDADGNQELLVGAPDSDVDGHRAAGAVYVFPGTSSGLDLAGARVLADSGPDVDARLGAALTTVKTGLPDAAHDEVVAGAPGADRVFLFLCTGIPGDSAEGNARCLP